MIRSGVALLAALFIVGCVSTNQRMPSSMPTTLADEYQDTIIAYCSPSKVVVFHDQNRCGLASAQERSCTEMPPYTSDILSVTQDGSNHSYADEKGTELFRLVSMRNGTFQLSNNQGLFKKPEIVKEDKLDPHFFNNLCP